MRSAAEYGGGCQRPPSFEELLVSGAVDPEPLDG